MSDRKVVLVNRAFLRKILKQDLVVHDDKLDAILSAGYRKLDNISKLSGCKCKHGARRNIVYDDIIMQLRQLSPTDIEPLKAHLNVTTLNLGRGHQI